MRDVLRWHSWVYQTCFVQAEDGIRDATVTGVQTCALPIAENQQTSVRRSADKIVGAEQSEGILLENQHNAENQQTSTLETDKPGEFSLKNTSLLKTSKQEGGKQADKIVESGQHEAIPVEKRHIAESRQAAGAAKLFNTKP